MTGSWKLVPVEAEKEQVAAYIDADPRRRRFAMSAKRDYAATISAAPTPPDEVLERMARAAYLMWWGDGSGSTIRRPARPAAWEALGEKLQAEWLEAMRAALSAVGEKTEP